VSRVGQRHLIQCQCVLPQYRKANQVIFHKFLVFSTLTNDVVDPKFVQCNNCGVVHKIYDLCKSEIVQGRDELRSVTKLEEISLSLPQDLRDVLKSYECDITVWEHLRFILEERRWGDRVVLTRENINGEVVGKVMTVSAGNRFSLEDYISRESPE
jgi:hypothetical protein